MDETARISPGRLQSSRAPAGSAAAPPADDAAIIADQIESAKTAAEKVAEIEDDDALAQAQSLRSTLLELKGEAE